MKKIITLLLTIFVYFPPLVFSDGGIGRLFLTPEERAEIDKLKMQTPEQVVVKKEPVPEKLPEQPKPEVGNISVNGLVYRKNGKSTAWVNNSNSYDGNTEGGLVQIDARDIKPDDVEIVIPLTDTTVNLKAGDTYEPDADRIDSLDYRQH